MKNVVLIVKPVGTFCNINCTYCYHSFYRKEREEKRFVMTEAVLEKLLHELSELEGQNFFRIIWHGGEPLLASVSFFEKVLFYQQKFFNPNVRVVNSIQTNGMLINSRWIKLFKVNNFQIGISLDGPSFIHDLHRVDKRGRGTYFAVLSSIKKLSGRYMAPGIVSVVTKQSLGHAKEIFNFFVENNLFKLNFSPAVDFDENGNLCSHSIEDGEWGNFMIEIFDEWLNHNDKRVKIQLLDNFLQGIIGGHANLCICREDCTNFISVDANGDLYFCGRFLGNPLFKLGNVLSDPLSNVVNGVKITEVLKSISIYQKNGCGACKWMHICNGGCPVHHYSLLDGFQLPYYFCNSTKLILDHISARVSAFL